MIQPESQDVASMWGSLNGAIVPQVLGLCEDSSEQLADQRYCRQANV